VQLTAEDHIKRSTFLGGKTPVNGLQAMGKKKEGLKNMRREKICMDPESERGTGRRGTASNFILPGQ